MYKKLFGCELAGIFFVIIMSVLMQNLYEITGHNLLGVMFGAVNNSIWEIVKTLIFPFVLWSMLELLSIRPPFYKFVVSKVIAVYFLGISYIAVNLLIKVLKLDGGYMANFVSAIACVSAALYLSYRLISSERNLRGFFMPSLFMLLLLMSFYVSFTPFPPHNPIFEDRNTGLYGIIPENIDRGAIVLDAFYNFD